VIGVVTGVVVSRGAVIVIVGNCIGLVTVPGGLNSAGKLPVWRNASNCFCSPAFNSPLRSANCKPTIIGLATRRPVAMASLILVPIVLKKLFNAGSLVAASALAAALAMALAMASLAKTLALSPTILLISPANAVGLFSIPLAKASLIASKSGLPVSLLYGVKSGIIGNSGGTNGVTGVVGVLSTGAT